MEIVVAFIRVAFIWAVLAYVFKIDKTASAYYAGVVILALYLFSLLSLYRRRTQEQHQCINDVPEEAPDMQITNAGKPVARYQGKDYPLWLEVNGSKMFVFNGQSHVATDVTVSLSEEEFIIAPCMSYKLLCPTNEDFLAEKLGIQVTDLTCFDGKTDLVEALAA